MILRPLIYTALGLLLLAGSCKSPTQLDSHRLFDGFTYRGSYQGDVQTTPAKLTSDREPTRPEAETVYVYTPPQNGSFSEYGTQIFPARLRQQGMEVISGPGVNGGDFFVADPTTTIFDITFRHGESCRGSLVGKQKNNGVELYVLRLHAGC